MKEYQRGKDNPYQLPHNLYMRVLYHIRDYDRLKFERQEVLHSSPCLDGQPKGDSAASSTENKAIRLMKLEEDCAAVDQALTQIPQEYRLGVMNNICYRSPYPIDAGYATYARWRRRLIYLTAKNLKLV